MAKNGLGKGLTDLFGGEDMGNAENEAKGIATLSMKLIEPNKDQPRKIFDEKAMEELTDSICKHGIVTPITVRKQENGYYQIIAGERRWRAARAAQLTEIPAMILNDITDEQVMELALIENLQRQDLNPIEEAEGYEVLMRSFGMTQDKVAERVGKSRPAVANALRLLALDTQTRQLVAQGRLSSGHARAVLAIHEEDKRFDAAKQMETMSVRQAESFVKKLNKTEQGTETQREEVDYVAAFEKQLESKLGRRVRIEIGKTHGTLSLEFYGNEDLERLSDALGGIHI